MTARSKRVKALREKVEPGRLYEIEEALNLLKELGSAKFAETIVFVGVPATFSRGCPVARAAFRLARSTRLINNRKE